MKMRGLKGKTALTTAIIIGIMDFFAGNTMGSVPMISILESTVVNSIMEITQGILLGVVYYKNK